MMGVLNERESCNAKAGSSTTPCISMSSDMSGTLVQLLYSTQVMYT